MEPIAAAWRTENAEELNRDYAATTLIDEYDLKYKSKDISDKKPKKRKEREIRSIDVKSD